MKKLYIGIFILSMLLFSACSSFTKQTQGPPPLPPLGETKTFDIEAKDFEFIPNIITVNQGDTVILNLKSTDVTHGFYLKDFNIDKKLEPNQTVQVKFVADKKGTFTFRCNVPCGEGHMEMTGTFIVQ
jgi:cytochrome c oxidase subunit II